MVSFLGGLAYFEHVEQWFLLGWFCLVLFVVGWLILHKSTAFLHFLFLLVIRIMDNVKNIPLNLVLIFRQAWFDLI